MFYFKNSSVSSFRPDDRKWAAGEMLEASAAEAVVEAEVAVVVAASKTASSGVYSLSRVMGQSVASFAVASFISLLFCFSVPVFCLR